MDHYDDLDPAEVRAELKLRAQTEGLKVAYESSLAICRDKTAPPSAKAAAAGILVKLAGPEEDAIDAKPESELTPEEIRRRLAQLQRRTRALEDEASELAEPQSLFD